jgi:hypothetical protein
MGQNIDQLILSTFVVTFVRRGPWLALPRRLLEEASGLGDETDGDLYTKSEDVPSALPKGPAVNYSPGSHDRTPIPSSVARQRISLGHRPAAACTTPGRDTPRPEYPGWKTDVVGQLILEASS